MADQPEARIIVRDNNGRSEISVYEPERMREHRTGWKENTRDAPKSIVQLKEQLERAGNRVSVKEM